MKKRNSILVFSFFIFLSSVYLSSFKSKTDSGSDRPHSRVQVNFNNEMDSLRISIQRLKSISLKADFKNSSDVSAIRKTFLNVRKKYKRVEFLLDYFQPISVKENLNGPPLPSLVPNAPGVFTKEPRGLQVIDELIFSDEIISEKNKLIEEVSLLDQSFINIYNFSLKNKITDRNFFEASRLSLIRIFALGVTGFDTPGSQNALPDALTSMQSMYDYWKFYLPTLPNKMNKALNSKFENAISYLKKNQNFNSFDRLHFLKEFINPLYKMTLEAHLSLGVETIYETGRNINPNWNYYSDNIFSKDFFNDSYYAGIPSKNFTAELIDLGRMLFFDPILSSNNQRACASCHNPSKAFTDGQVKSIAMDFDGTVNRNAPTLINSVYVGSFFYDLRTEFLKDQFEHVINDPKEFHTSYVELIDKLKQSEDYQKMFKKVFAEFKVNETIGKHTISTALAAYVTSLKAFNSEFDQYVRGESKKIKPEVVRGFNLFMGKAACGTCHFAPVFNGTVPPYYKETESEVLGVPATSDSLNVVLDPDLGRYGGKLKQQAEFYKHSFKTVTIRNVELTAPYMHNGVFKSLEEVMDFYNKGGGAGLGLNVPYQTLSPDPLELSKDEIKDIISFMKSLTDTTGLTSKPYKLPSFTSPVELDERKIGGVY